VGESVGVRWLLVLAAASTPVGITAVGAATAAPTDDVLAAASTPVGITERGHDSRHGGLRLVRSVEKSC
jgi:hypothetical protein